MPTGIALLGCGTVGSAVAGMLLSEQQRLFERSGTALVLRRVLVRETGKTRATKLPQRLLTTDFTTILADPDVSLVVEAMGGVEPARRYILQALAAGKHVVTANKHLLALHGNEIFSAAAKANRCVGFEASCGGAIPIVMALSRGLAANDISRVVGIVNGTCNYILTEMSASNKSFQQALAEAQAAGYAEADPTLDVNGADSAHKLAVLAALAFGVKIPFNKINVSGIDNLQAVDLRYSRELGYTCKLLAIAEKLGGEVSLRVHVALAPRNQMLANVSGAFNAISVVGHASGQTLYYGRGAGAMPTASAVLADVLEVAGGRASVTKLPAKSRGEALRIVPINQVTGRHYLRMMALDVPGVIAQITRILGRHNISVSAIVQHESLAGRHVPVVILTHEARDHAAAAAVRQIDQLKSITGHTVRIRVVES